MEAALEQSDPALIAHALGTVARVRGMTQIARDTGMAREVLSRALSPEGNPSFGTVLRVMDAPGLVLTVAPRLASKARSPRRPAGPARSPRAPATRKAVDR
jgi:probable addiction module antidote protein